MTNEQLVARIQAGENVSENMAQLYDQVKDFIRSIAWKYQHTGEMEDLEQEGYLALYPAIDGYDPAAGCKFLTYAEKWIKAADAALFADEWQLPAAPGSLPGNGAEIPALLFGV